MRLNTRKALAGAPAGAFVCLKRFWLACSVVPLRSR